MPTSNLIVFPLIAAAAGHLGGAGVGSNATQPNAPAPPASPATQSVTGYVYVRDPNVAYPSNYTPGFGVEGVKLSVGDQTVVTGPDGTYRFTIPQENTTGYINLTAQKDGYFSTQYPVSFNEIGQNINVALYDPVEIKPRPGFVSGVIPMDSGGGIPDIYKAGLFPSTFNIINYNINPNYTVIVNTIWITKLDTKANLIKLEENDGAAVMSPTTDMWKKLAPQMREFGLKPMMMIDIFPSASVVNWGGEIDNVSFGNEIFWKSYFKQYTDLVLNRVEVAKSLGVDSIILGMNQGFMSRLPLHYMADLVGAVRLSGYTGKIGWFSGVNGSHHEASETETIKAYNGQDGLEKFSKLFDFIGLDINDVIQNANPSNQISTVQSRENIKSNINDILDRVSNLPVPIYLQIATPSVHGAASLSNYIEPCLDCDGHGADRFERELNEQADLYQAIAEVVNDTPTGNGRVMGLFTWGYNYKNDFSREVNGAPVAFDKSASIRGKPAEYVMRNWIAGWRGYAPRSQPVPANSPNLVGQK